MGGRGCGKGAGQSPRHRCPGDERGHGVTHHAVPMAQSPRHCCPGCQEGTRCDTPRRANGSKTEPAAPQRDGHHQCHHEGKETHCPELKTML